MVTITQNVLANKHVIYHNSQGLNLLMVNKGTE